MQFAGDRSRVLARSRSGRWVQLWLPVEQLANFRFKMIPADHPLYERVSLIGMPDSFTDSDLAVLNSRGSALPPG
jgi:hypothetical protein